MSKATRIRQQNARERIAAQRAAEKRAEARRRLFITGGSILGVIVIVVAFIVVKSLGSPSTPTPTPGGPGGTPLAASVARDITTVPASTLNAVGAGSVPSQVQTPVKVISGTPLTSNGKPEMLYVGAEFCPYCAAMRWSMAVALSRFGTLSPLHGIHSAATVPGGGAEAYPNTATLTFYKSGYSSKYLAFVPVENEKIDHSPLQATTSQQQAIWQKYDANSYPFIDIGNKYMISIIYSPQVLAGKTWGQIAAALHDPSSPIAAGADGAANYITAAICKTTNSQPASVCTSPAIKALAGKL
jgi:thiol-disulfide isomerase/thioredoxin